MEQFHKYYTPERHEFYIGFEFEAHISANLIQNQTEEWQATSVQFGDIFFVHNFPIEWRFRVKYLDSEDIISLGWRKINDALFENSSHLLIRSPHSVKVIEIRQKDFDPSFKNARFFLGEIKNKSELKILMKQLKLL